ncbi:hypothetical protein [Paenisporosarcina sp. TG20]|uniref:hypothetical protein n=1 Tax=Paenisporosarcina sp. TG20 TaxID=1211706 RepID=UPI000315C471|nr:hypothetical protein [Paenisporosarcina sp. TG20]
MSVIVAFVPLMIMFGIFMIFISNKKSTIPKKTRLTSKFTTRLVMVYVFFLLVSSVIAVFISPSKTANERVELSQLNDDIYSKLSIGNEEDIPASLILNEWTNEIDGDMFTLETQDDYDLPIVIMIEQVESTEKIVEATLYKGIYLVNEIEIPEYLENIEVDWQGDQLIVNMPNQDSVSMSFFRHDFTFTQFSGNASVDESKSMSAQFPILYIKVPKSLTLNVDEERVEMVVKTN